MTEFLGNRKLSCEVKWQWNETDSIFSLFTSLRNQNFITLKWDSFSLPVNIWKALSKVLVTPIMNVTAIKCRINSTVELVRWWSPSMARELFDIDSNWSGIIFQLKNADSLVTSHSILMIHSGFSLLCLDYCMLEKHFRIDSVFPLWITFLWYWISYVESHQTWNSNSFCFLTRPHRYIIHRW